MPIYEYKCEKCGNIFEELRGLSHRDDPVECPDCHSEAKRIVSQCAASIGGSYSTVGSSCGSGGFS